MFLSKLESEADYDHSILSVTTESSTSLSSSSACYHNKDIKNKVAAESRKKVRSIKLGRFPSLRFTARQAKIQSDYLSSDAACSLHQMQSPNYMKTTTSSDAKKENMQKSARTLLRRSSFRPGKSLTRLSSKKFRRSSTRKLSGGSDVKKKLKKSRSVKLGKRSSIALPDDADTSLVHLKSTECSDVENTQFQASSHDSESCLSSNDESKRSSSNLNLNLAKCNKSSRTSVLRHPRILTKMASLRTKRTSMKKPSQMLDSTIHKATCSSALKDSKITDHFELQSEEIEGMKVCPYSYCSLHGHKHSTVPPLKRFVSMRRRVLKTQSFRRSEHSSNSKKGIRRRETIRDKDAAVQETANKSREAASIRQMVGPKADLNEERSNGGESEDINHSESDAEILIGEPSYSHMCLKENLHTSKFPTAEKKEEVIIESNSHTCVLTLDRPEHIDFDESSRACHEEVPVGGRVLEEVNVDSNSSLNLDLNTLQEHNSPCVDEEPFNMSRNLNANIFVESKEINALRSASTSAGELLEQTTAREESNEDSSADSDSDVVDKTKTGKQKNMGLWNLIYQNMVSGIAEGDEMQPPLNKMNMEEQESDAKIQNKRNAIKLVQEAFDKMLSEIPDQISDDQSVNSDRTSDKELAEKNNDEFKELSISCSFDSGKDSTVEDQKERSFETDQIKGSEGQKTESKVESKSNQQKSKNWSNLKKIITLRKFVKALEKVRNINPQKPRYVPVESEPDAEKVNLRRQNMGERKNSEEWMLDYALQQVISTLAPAQKRKVALLVQAFETVGPLPENNSNPRSNVAAEEHSPQSLSELKEPSSESASIHKTLGFKDSFWALKLDNADCNSIVNNGQQDSTKNPHEVLVNGEVREEMCLISASEVLDSDYVQEIASNYRINASGENSDEFKSQKPNSNVISSVPVTETVEESSKAIEVKTKLQNKFLKALTAREDSSADVPHGKQKNMRLWYLIYKHMVSGNENVLDEATDNEVQSNDAMENHNIDTQKVELRQIEAIRIVEKAIDEISLPDSQDDSPDGQSVTKDRIPDHEHLERSNGESKNEKVEKTTRDSKESCLNTDKDNKTELNNENKPKLSPQKSWSNLKKVILLKRFVKAMEQVRKFNPREPQQFLPFDSEKEPEKVHLRHQEMEDRKNADEWMLDYALQQVVAKLTPARKRKVELLVEAFETVIPTIGS